MSCAVADSLADIAAKCQGMNVKGHRIVSLRMSKNSIPKIEFSPIRYSRWGVQLTNMPCRDYHQDVLVHFRIGIRR